MKSALLDALPARFMVRVTGPHVAGFAGLGDTLTAGAPMDPALFPLMAP